MKSQQLGISAQDQTSLTSSLDDVGFQAPNITAEHLAVDSDSGRKNYTFIEAMNTDRIPFASRNYPTPMQI